MVYGVRCTTSYRAWVSDMAVVITGGAGAIGFAVAKRLANHTMVHILDIDRDRGKDTAYQLGKNGNFIHCDVRSIDDLNRARDLLVDSGGVSGLIIAAGVNKTVNAVDLEVEEWTRVLDTNLTGAFLSMQAFFPLLAESSGSVVAVASK